MKSIWKLFTIRGYLRHVRRSSKHMQHIHALIFAGTITAGIAGIILYSEYGFWHEKYVADDAPVFVETTPPILSPMEALGRFIADAKEQFKSARSSSGSFLEGKETFQR